MNATENAQARGRERHLRAVGRDALETEQYWRRRCAAAEALRPPSQALLEGLGPTLEAVANRSDGGYVLIRQGRSHGVMRSWEWRVSVRWQGHEHSAASQSSLGAAMTRMFAWLREQAP